MNENLINLSAREVMSHVEKSQYTLVDKPLFRKLVCKHDYHHYEGVVFEQGKEYAVWITQCFRPAEKKRRFFHYVAVPHAREEERPFYYIVSEDIFGEYDKGNIEVVTEIGGEKYKLINDFEGWGMLIPKWMFCRKRVREYAEQTLGPADFGYVLCARNLGRNIDNHSWNIAWEICAHRNKMNTGAYFNLFNGKFVERAGDYPFKYPIQSGAKKIITGHSVIKADKGDLIVRMPTPVD